MSTTDFRRKIAITDKLISQADNILLLDRAEIQFSQTPNSLTEDEFNNLKLLGFESGFNKDEYKIFLKNVLKTDLNDELTQIKFDLIDTDNNNHISKAELFSVFDINDDNIIDANDRVKMAQIAISGKGAWWVDAQDIIPDVTQNKYTLINPSYGIGIK